MSSPLERERSYPSEVVRASTMDGIDPKEFIRRKIQQAASAKNPLLRENDPYVLIGYENFEGQFYLCGSFSNEEDARKRLTELNQEEQEHAQHIETNINGPQIFVGNSYSLFTREGLVILPAKPQ